MFQYDFGPPKHVLHLVWSVLGISTAIKTALKVALYEFFDGPLAPLNGQFMEKVNHYNRTKHKDFLMGPLSSKRLLKGSFFFDPFPKLSTKCVAGIFFLIFSAHQPFEISVPCESL